MIDFTGVKALTIPEGSVKKITRKSDGALIWEKSTGRLPSAYQEVEWIQAAANVGAHINLGFSYDTKAIVNLGQGILNDNTAYIFGAAENSGKLRCMISSPYGSAVTAYHSTSTNYVATAVGYNKGIINHIKVSWETGNLCIENLTTGKKATKQDVASYTMSSPLYLFAQNYNGSTRYGDTRRIAFFQYYDKNNTLICDLVPCYRKSDGVIGMYDLITNKLFTNVGTGSFTRGADV